MLKRIVEAFNSFGRQVWLLVQSVANAFRQRRRMIALREQETERLDRIRNPSKYLGK
jgi:hypothetical protein